MKIQTSELKRVTELLLSYLDEKGIKEIDISYDYYWFLQKEQYFNVEKSPNSSEFSVGQLSSDWKDLISLINRDRSPIFYHLVWLSTVYRAVGDTLIG